MQRGKQQILFNYMPDRTFDFENIAMIAKVTEIRGAQRTDLNLDILLMRIAEEVSAWAEEYRPIFRNDVINSPDRFILLNPSSVESEIYPKVLWCQNDRCGLVVNCETRTSLPQKCPRCKTGQLKQLRFVRVHRCGSIKPLEPPMCNKCHTKAHMCLDTRKSERISNFKWICRQCGTTSGVFSGNCGDCQWPDPELRRMDIEVHRSGRTYYVHYTSLLNVPDYKYDVFFSQPQWQAIVAAKYLGISPFSNISLSEFQSPANSPTANAISIDRDILDNLLERQIAGEITAQQMAEELALIRNSQQTAIPANELAEEIAEKTGVAWDIWNNAARALFESIMPCESGNPINVPPDSRQSQKAKDMGFSKISLISDYPIVTATYGYSRIDYQPNACRLNPFPAQREYGGKYPIFVDQIQADAILFSLDKNRVLKWLTLNGYTPQMPKGTDNLSLEAYFVELFHDISLRSSIAVENSEVRMVFGLLHTLSHFLIKQAALLCGLDQVSLSEYLLPQPLTFAIYCNHRFGATIGALTALFEQSFIEWLDSVKESHRCVYDPVCNDTSGNCHACTQLSETSCRFFNLNLSRAFLFGGHDTVLGDIKVGYFSPLLK